MNTKATLTKFAKHKMEKFNTLSSDFHIHTKKQYLFTLFSLFSFFIFSCIDKQLGSHYSDNKKIVLSHFPTQKKTKIEGE